MTMYKKTHKDYSKPVKPKAVENIADYSQHNVCYRFTKSKSPQSVVIIDYIDDPWFKYVITYKTKSGQIVDKNTIIEGDIETWLSAVKRWGFTLQQ